MTTMTTDDEVTAAAIRSDSLAPGRRFHSSSHTANPRCSRSSASRRTNRLSTEECDKKTVPMLPLHVTATAPTASALYRITVRNRRFSALATERHVSHLPNVSAGRKPPIAK